MTQKKLLSRRNLLKAGTISALALSASRIFAKSGTEVCEGTPKQPEGPFYPISDQPDKNNDLTIVEGKTEPAFGVLIYLSGKIIDQNCEVVPNVVVEIWQACETGRYNHPSDNDNPNPLDPNFQYWGITTSNAHGVYTFKTIMPGHYAAGPGWIRPPHIHFKVHKKGIRELITQMYFAGNQYNDSDLIFRKIPAEDRDSVVRHMIERPMENGRQAFDMTFDISVEKLV